MPEKLINPSYTNTKFSIRGIILQHFKLFFYHLFSRAFLATKGKSFNVWTKIATGLLYFFTTSYKGRSSFIKSW